MGCCSSRAQIANVIDGPEVEDELPDIPEKQRTRYNDNGTVQGETRSLQTIFRQTTDIDFIDIWKSRINIPLAVRNLSDNIWPVLLRIADLGSKSKTLRRVTRDIIAETDEQGMLMTTNVRMLLNNATNEWK